MGRLWALVALLSVCLGAAPASRTTPRTVAAIDPALVAGRGAQVAFDEYEAENAATDGDVIGPDRRFTTFAAEASGRRAVRLEGAGRFVEFTLARAANAMTLRYAVPDSRDGRGIDATLGLYVAGRRLASVAVTSRYGWFYGAYPFTNHPADGRPHHFFDHARLLLPATLPAGTTVRIAIGSEDKAPWYLVDLADFELVRPPAVQPPGSMSALDFGADPSGRTDATEALRRGIAAARASGRPLWLPAGTFRAEGHLIVDQVAIKGAGMWHTTLRGRGLGLYGKPAPQGSSRVTLSDFALIGAVDERIDNDQVNGIGGSIGGGSVIERLWLQHHKVGLWFDGPMRGIRISGLRILDMTADGLNFRRGVSDAVVENSFIRGVGDDGLAAWSHQDADHNIIFQHNSIIAPVLANGIAIYGGHSIDATDNLIADTLTEGGGLHVGNRFDAIPVAGRISLARNMIIRGGSIDPRWRFGVGAVWFYALDAPINARIDLTDTVIISPTAELLLWLGKPIAQVSVYGLHVAEAEAPIIAVRSGGRAIVQNISAENQDSILLRSCEETMRVVWLARVRQSSTKVGCLSQDALP